MRSLNFVISIVLICYNPVIAHPSWGIVVDQNNNIYFPDIAHNDGTIWKLTPEGELIQILDHCHAHNIVLDPQGNIITANGEGNHAMIKIYPNGTVDTLYQTRNIDKFFGGNCTWSEKYGIIYGQKSKQLLYTIDANGNQKPLCNYKFVWNQALYVDSDQNVYATDIGIENGALIKIDTSGIATIIARDLISKLDRPKVKHNDILLGITKDQEGNIYVVETAGKRIIKISKDLKTENFYQSKSNWFPCAITFSNGDAFIMEYRHGAKGIKGPRILKINNNGNKEVLLDYDSFVKAQKEIATVIQEDTTALYVAIRNLVFGLLIIAFSMVVVQFAQKSREAS